MKSNYMCEIVGSLDGIMYITKLLRLNGVKFSTNEENNYGFYTISILKEQDNYAAQAFASYYCHNCPGSNRKQVAYIVPTHPYFEPIRRPCSNGHNKKYGIAGTLHYYEEEGEI